MAEDVRQQYIITSWYRHAQLVKDDLGRVFFRTPERLQFQVRDDTVGYPCRGHESLIDITIWYYQQFTGNPITFYPIVAEFQPHPIQDPHIPLPEGTIILLPSWAYMMEVPMGESLADNPVL